MKKVLLVAVALTLTLLISLGLFSLLEPSSTPISKDNRTLIQFIDIDNNNSECDDLTLQIKTILNEPQICETANDCMINHYGCPFGCQSFTNKINHQKVNDLIEIREQSCHIKCRYRCSSDGINRIPACVDNLCSTVESINEREYIIEYLKYNNR